jgi:predicted helicase
VTFVETEAEREVRLASEARDRELSLSPEKKRARGIVHTPGRLARFVARRVDELLREELGLKRGLADPRVTIVDPACGTGAFLAAVLSVVSERASAPAGLVGFDVDEDAVAICRAALDVEAARKNTRLCVEARNTLASLHLPIESEVICVLGNPPWAGKSANAEATLTATLLEDFRRETGGDSIRERKVGVLSDDYVRFVRWSAELCRRAPRGSVMGLVTNASFLNGPVHRGMRAALLRWFSGIEVFDLGGSALLSRGDLRDDNVFGVRPSVACTFGVRAAGHGDLLETARFRYARLYGSREEKLGALADATPTTARVVPRHPFVPFDASSNAATFPAGWLSLDAIFPFHREGVQTNRDEAVVAEDEATLVARLRKFAEGEPDAALAKAYQPSAHYDPARAREAVRRALTQASDSGEDTGARLGIVRLAYRPYDDRVFCSLKEICHRARPNLIEAMCRSRWALLSVRKDRGQAPWNHFAVTLDVPDNCYLSLRSSCRTRAFPTHDPAGQENVSEIVRERFAERLGRAPSAPELSLYVLAILASETYRRSYEEALRADYPKIPLPEGKESFDRGVRLGETLKERWLGPRQPAADWRIGHHKIHEKPVGTDGALEACDSFFRAEWGNDSATEPNVD